MRVVIGEDEALLRAGLSHVLQQGGFDVVAAAGDTGELVRAVELHRPDLLVTDIRMPPSHADEGLRAALDLRRRHPDLLVVVLSQHLQRRYVIDLLAQPTAA
jgi:DNA-binding NarL/FixJ family response regulator